MIVEERFVTYINLLSGENTPLLEEIEKEAHESGIPIIRRETQSLFKGSAGSQKAAEDSGGGNSYWVFRIVYGGV